MDIVSSEKIKYAFNKLNNFINANYSNIDFSAFIKVDHIDKPELTVIAKAIQAFNIMIAALEEDVKESLPSLIPYVDSDYRRIVILDIISDFESLATCLIDNDLKAAKIHLRYVNYYLADLNLSSANEKALLKILIESASQLKKELEAELGVIKNNSSLIHNAPLIYEDINSIYKNSKSTQDLIVKIKEQTYKILENTEKDVDSKTKNFGDLATKIDEMLDTAVLLESNLKRDGSTLDELVKKIENELNNTLSKQENIKRLEQLKAGDVLSNVFINRKSHLQYLAIFWIILFIATLCGTIWWTLEILKNYNAIVENSWLNFLLNYVKTAPLYFIVGFSLSQYRKERNLAEEYAFKAAVSETLTAFSEKLGSNDNENRIAQIEMLQKSISMIYTQPRVHTESEKHMVSLNSKDLKEIVKHLVDSGIKVVKP